MFIDVEVYNRGEFGKLADLVRDRCRKGSQLMVEGRLHLDQWDDKATGQKRSKHKIVAENLQLLDPRMGGEGPGGGMGGHTDDEYGAPPPARSNFGNRGPARSAPSYPDDAEGPGGSPEGDIPF